MKKLNTLLLSMAFSLSMVAQGPSPLPKSLRPERNVAKVMPDPVNNDTRGVNMYASLMVAQSNIRSMVKFNSSKPGTLTALAPFSPDAGAGSNDLNAVRSGVYHDGKYYALLSAFYTYDELPVAFVNFDLETGKYTVIRNMKNDTEYGYWYEMTYDNKRNKCWAIGLDPNGNMSVSSLYEVDLSNGTFTKVVELEAYFLTFACDYWGNLYGIRYKAGEDGKTNEGSILSTIDPETGKILTSVELSNGGNPYKADYAQSMSFDYTTGKLWWLGMSYEGYQHLFDVNIENGELNDHGSFGLRDQGVALYVPYLTADNGDAPARVDDITSLPADKGESKATITWKNPSKTWNGQSLKDLKDVKIYRDGTLIETVDCTGKEGSDMNFVDTNVPTGQHIYNLIPTNGSGNGVKDSIPCFVGKDVPGEVRNASVNANDDKTAVTITWSRPTEGANKGWYDENTTTYTLTRLPDSVKVAEKITATTFVDTNLADERLYSYLITASDNELGDGLTAKTDKVKAGHPYKTPYNCGFDSDAEADPWTSIDVNHDGYDWGYLGGSWYLTKAMSLDQSPYNSSDDWLFSPKVALEKGKQYKVTVLVSQDNIEKYQNFKVTVGKENTAEAQTKDVFNVEDFFIETYYEKKQFSGKFTADETGAYNFGLYCNSEAMYNSLKLFEFNVKELSDIDMSLDSLAGPIEIVQDAPAEYKVTVTNDGLKNRSDYSIRLSDVTNASEPVELATITDVPEVAAGETKTFPVTFTPASEGDIAVRAELVLKDDATPDDNVSNTVKSKVLPAGTVDWNKIIFDEGTASEATRYPIDHISASCESEILYTAKEIGCSNEAEIHKLAFEYNSEKPAPDVSMKLYLANVDATELAEKSTNNYSDYTLVYDGTVSFEQGTGKLLSVTLPEAFKYDNTKSLYVRVEAVPESTTNTYPIHFITFGNDDTYAPPYYLTYTIINNGNSNSFGIGMRPKLYLALQELTTGINSAVAAEGSVWYDSESQNLVVEGMDVKNVNVYDISGKVIRSGNVSGRAQSIHLPLAKGIYVVRVVTSDNGVKTIKLSVK